MNRRDDPAPGKLEVAPAIDLISSLCARVGYILFYIYAVKKGIVLMKRQH